MKRCFKCEKKKSIKEFHKNKQKKDGLDHLCISCRQLHTRKQTLEQRYNISIEEYNILLKIQHECCAICSKHQSEFVKGLGVDHDHETGLIRGLLCFTCNGALGHYELKQKEFTKYLRITSPKIIIKFLKKLLNLNLNYISTMNLGSGKWQWLNKGV